MNTAALDPRISEFDTEEQPASYDAWFRLKVQEAIDDKRPRIPHDQVAHRVEKILSEIRSKKAA
ncbi:MAG: stability determinant [Gammaproteobacteria bacterium]|uniref:type II toxin-antitoxin system RelB family antitoxin n=1 Tax=Rhodoferax sp. TaxID=50421 RepID=UPI001852B57C|nr:stability determinant [Rhodoferax sp.]MBU3899373.1 stability determinant [Gammaproteobacteria bacterium]MBA3058395.1 stability determinant [Rhodoferax sp.]MBU3997595.1 stability determinant [Gammaproteobacteria bacterium]MBU4080628.1 stability determinant [Gammaproteobacteria bacterium]MBU4113591.1 stability determinant [Gammaproteobacteria bacterium]